MILSDYSRDAAKTDDAIEQLADSIEDALHHDECARVRTRPNTILIEFLSPEREIKWQFTVHFVAGDRFDFVGSQSSKAGIEIDEESITGKEVLDLIMGYYSNFKSGAEASVEEVKECIRKSHTILEAGRAFRTSADYPLSKFYNDVNVDSQNSGYSLGEKDPDQETKEDESMYTTERMKTLAGIKTPDHKDRNPEAYEEMQEGTESDNNTELKSLLGVDTLTPELVNSQFQKLNQKSQEGEGLTPVETQLFKLLQAAKLDEGFWANRKEDFMTGYNRERERQKEPKPVERRPEQEPIFPPIKYIEPKSAKSKSPSSPEDYSIEQEGYEQEDESKWIQGAVNPSHKGYCSPMSKSTCTPRRAALARRFKKGIEEAEEPSPEYKKEVEKADRELAAAKKMYNDRQPANRAKAEMRKKIESGNWTEADIDAIKKKYGLEEGFPEDFQSQLSHPKNDPNYHNPSVDEPHDTYSKIIEPAEPEDITVLPRQRKEDPHVFIPTSKAVRNSVKHGANEQVGADVVADENVEELDEKKKSKKHISKTAVRAYADSISQAVANYKASYGLREDESQQNLQESVVSTMKRANINESIIREFVSKNKVDEGLYQSPYAGPKISGERHRVVKNPSGGHTLTFVPQDTPLSPDERDVLKVPSSPPEEEEPEKLSPDELRKHLKKYVDANTPEDEKPEGKPKVKSTVDETEEPSKSKELKVGTMSRKDKIDRLDSLQMYKYGKTSFPGSKYNPNDPSYDEKAHKEHPFYKKDVDEGEEGEIGPDGVWVAKWVKNKEKALPKLPDKPPKSKKVEKGKGLIAWPHNPEVNEGGIVSTNTSGFRGLKETTASTVSTRDQEDPEVYDTVQKHLKGVPTAHIRGTGYTDKYSPTLVHKKSHYTSELPGQEKEPETRTGSTPSVDEIKLYSNPSTPYPGSKVVDKPSKEPFVKDKNGKMVPATEPLDTLSKVRAKQDTYPTLSQRLGKESEIDEMTTTSGGGGTGGGTTGYSTPGAFTKDKKARGSERGIAGSAALGYTIAEMRKSIQEAKQNRQKFLAEEKQRLIEQFKK